MAFCGFKFVNDHISCNEFLELTHQYWDFYCIAFPKDNPVLRTVVFLELVLETIQSVAITSDIVQFCTFVYTDSFTIEGVGNSWYSVALLTGLSTYYLFSLSVAISARRWRRGSAFGSLSTHSNILLLSSCCADQVKICGRAYNDGEAKSWLLAIFFSRSLLCLQLSLCQFAASVAVTVQTKEAISNNASETNRSLTSISVSFLARQKLWSWIHWPKFYHSFQLWGASSLACDVVIAAIMTYYVSTRIYFISELLIASIL